VYYKGVMERLLNRIRRVRPGMCESGDWFLLHDNAPSHNVTIIKQFLAQQKVSVLDHPPYSPDLAPADYFLFPKVKSHFKGCLFDLISDIQKAVTSTFKHHCKGRLLQRHPEALWPCKCVCTVRRDVCWKLNNKSVISFTQILFIMPVLKLSRRTVNKVVSKIFQTDTVKIVKLTIGPIGHFHPRSSSLPHVDTDSTVSSIFGTLPGSPFLSECQALSTIRPVCPQCIKLASFQLQLHF